MDKVLTLFYYLLMSDNDNQKREYPRGNWVVVNFETRGVWVSEDTDILYKGYKLIAMPAEQDKLPAVAMVLNQSVEGDPELTRENAQMLLCNFLSAHSWHSGHMVNINGFSGGGYPSRYAPSKNVPYTQAERVHFFDEIPEVYEEKETLALALMREAKAINNPAFQFLSYSKILNINHSRGEKQKKWINNNLEDLKHGALKRAQELQKDSIDIGDYLYHSGRCAVAHANIAPDQPIINPDDYRDYKRLSQDMPLIAALAERYIERVIGVKSSQTLYQEHLYELHGFKVFLGTDFIEKVLKNEDVEGYKCPIMPRISLKIRGQKQSDILDALKCEIENFDEKGVILKAFDTDKKISLPLFLNLREERLQSDFFSEAGFLGDDGTPEAMDRVAEFFEFRKHYLCNGILEVWASDYNILLGRCDAFVPVNCFVQPEKADEQINNFREEANKRRIGAA